MACNSAMGWRWLRCIIRPSTPTRMWAFIAYLIAATAFYTILVMIAQPDPYDSESWEMPDDIELPTSTASTEYEAYRKAA
jgi:hypothetical protein